MQAMRIVSRLPPSLTRMVSPSPTDRTLAAVAGPASSSAKGKRIGVSAFIDKAMDREAGYLVMQVPLPFRARGPSSESLKEALVVMLRDLRLSL